MVSKDNDDIDVWCSSDKQERILLDEKKELDTIQSTTWEVATLYTAQVMKQSCFPPIKVEPNLTDRTNLNDTVNYLVFPDSLLIISINSKLTTCNVKVF